MSEREPPEKQTVKHTDELLKKSRRLIDELEFILRRLDRSPPRTEARARQAHSQRQGLRRAQIEESTASSSHSLAARV